MKASPHTNPTLAYPIPPNRTLAQPSLSRSQLPRERTGLTSDPQMEVTLGSCLRCLVLHQGNKVQKRSRDPNSSLGFLNPVKPRVQLGEIRALRGPLVARSLTFPKGFPRARGRRRDCDDPRPAPNTSPSQPATRGGTQGNQGRPGGRHLELRTGRKTLL